jgi:hypothetical protein
MFRRMLSWPRYAIGPTQAWPGEPTTPRGNSAFMNSLNRWRSLPSHTASYSASGRGSNPLMRSST